MKFHKIRWCWEDIVICVCIHIFIVAFLSIVDILFFSDLSTKANEIVDMSLVFHKISNIQFFCQVTGQAINKHDVYFGPPCAHCSGQTGSIMSRGQRGESNDEPCLLVCSTQRPQSSDHSTSGLLRPPGGRRSPAVACWASDHWVASSNPLRGKFRH